MYRRDYILRLIERFGRALIVLRDRILRRAVESATVRAELGDIAREAGIDLDVARVLDPKMLLMWLSPTGEVDEAKFWLLGELLYLEAQASRADGAGDRGRGNLERALALFGHLPAGWTPPGDLTSAGGRASEIERLLFEDRQEPGPSDERPGP